MKLANAKFNGTDRQNGRLARNKRATFAAGIAILLGAAVGCDSEPLPPPTASPEIVAELEAEKEEKAAEEAARQAAADEYVLKEAGVGATGKGQYGISSDDPRSIVTVPISTYFQAQEKAVFDMQIPHALNLFQATEGRYPNSQEEFMSRIVAANQIVLPKLPEGDEYVYDVPNHILMIKTKRGAN